MFTCWSDSARVMSDSSRLRSSASTWICTRNELGAVGAHSTSTSRSGVGRRLPAFTQSVRCTETPEPWVTKPRIWSPGTGVQHFASFDQQVRGAITWTAGVGAAPVRCAAGGR